MFQRGLRRLRRDERGQALVIGAIAMLVVALTVLSSVSIGHGVYSKIKLQDAADAQSYSIAVKEARAYNFLAYTNRAMVVQYNAMLTFMAYLSHAYYLKETIGRLAQVLSYVPYIGPIFKAVEKVIDGWMKIVDGIARALIPLLTALNVALWLAQEAVVYATFIDLFTAGDSDAIKLTDPKATAGYSMSLDSVGGVSGILSNIGMNMSNMKNFLHPIDDAVKSSSGLGSDPVGTGKRSKLLGNNKLSQHQMAKYRLLMGSIVNSARREWTARGKDVKLIGRRWKINACALGAGIKLEKTAASEIKSFSEDFDNNVKDQLFSEDAITMRIKMPCPIGFNVFKFDYKMQAAADRRDGFHGQRLLFEVGDPFSGAKVDIPFGKQERHHPWPGITPFFMGDPSFYRPYAYHFGYPCNMVVTTKNMIEKPNPFELKGKFMEGEGTFERNGVLDMSWEKVGGEGSDDPIAASLMPLFRDRTGGMVAASVGRAIYHRPGDWKEEPNFFNPLWTARLAPVRTHWEKPHASMIELRIVDLAMQLAEGEKVSGINY